MPVWHARTEQWRAEGKLQLLGIVQEQHAERARLYAQWQGLDWPIVCDSLNLLRNAAVPQFVAVDAAGVVRSVRPRPETLGREFVERDWEVPQGLAPPAPLAAGPEAASGLRQAVRDAPGDAAAWRGWGTHLTLWGGVDRVNDALRAFQRARELDPRDAATEFGLGAVHRLRWDSPDRQAKDFGAAVRHWEAALERRPNEYIWRRRIQQYGPKLIKPYPFYDWVAEAQQAIRERGERPVELAVALTAAERARPRAGAPSPAASEPPREPDPRGAIQADDGLIQWKVDSVPTRLRAGETARVHIALWPSVERQAHWNNEAEPLRVWITPPAGWQIDRQLLTAPQPRAAETTERRSLDFELTPPRDAPPGTARVKGYALYYVCEGVEGKCLYLRLPLAAEVSVASGK